MKPTTPNPLSPEIMSALAHAMSPDPSVELDADPTIESQPAWLAPGWED